MKKYCYQGKDRFFILEEDFVGWYLIAYEDNNMQESVEDHLLDSYEDAIMTANDLFNINKQDWTLLKS